MLYIIMSFLYQCIAKIYTSTNATGTIIPCWRFFTFILVNIEVGICVPISLGPGGLVHPLFDGLVIFFDSLYQHIGTSLCSGSEQRTDPEKTWVSNSSIATYWTGWVGKVPFNLWWNDTVSLGIITRWRMKRHNKSNSSVRGGMFLPIL